MDHHQMSERRARKASGFCRMMVRYETRRSGDDRLRERMKALALERRRFGYRRIHVLLKREGHRVNHKKLFRLYREDKLTVRKRGGRKRAIGTRAPMLVPMTANDRWSLDFVSDQLTDGRRFRVLKSSMIAPGNAWASSPIHRSRAFGLLVSWIGSSRSVASLI
jgi:putative transposase